ncbi:hypothetical protein DAMA08_013790 [Martiniozyma asiatica (nom. inval.)]|nr:hypothetical protein DAMA08_013790 [Martiniozyma asiatica]
METLSKLFDLPTCCTLETTVLEVALLMKRRRCHCVIVTDEKTGKILGLVTTKDLAFKIVAQGLPFDLKIDCIMTREPWFVLQGTSVNDALQLMVNRKIRHLPVVDNLGIAIGMLNITTCFYHAMIRLERMSEEMKGLQCTFDGLKSNSELEFSNYSVLNEYTVKSDQNKGDNEVADFLNPTALSQEYMDLNISNRKKKIVNDLKSLIESMKEPDLKSLLKSNRFGMTAPMCFDAKTDILTAAKLFKDKNVTAALIVHKIGCTNVDNVIGILTTKDISFRVLASNLNSTNTKVARVMTPKPDFAEESTSIHEALRLMYEGQYLNLPISNSNKEVIGLVNVLQLTYAMLQTLELTHIQNPLEPRSETASLSDPLESSGPAWNKFWDSLERPLVEKKRASFEKKRNSSTSLYSHGAKSEPIVLGAEQNAPIYKGSVLNTKRNCTSKATSNFTQQETKDKNLNEQDEDAINSYSVLAMSTSTDISSKSFPLKTFEFHKQGYLNRRMMIKLQLEEAHNLHIGVGGKIYKFHLTVKSTELELERLIIQKLQTRIAALQSDEIRLDIGYYDRAKDFVSIQHFEDLEIAIEEEAEDYSGGITLQCRIMKGGAKGCERTGDKSVPVKGISRILAVIAGVTGAFVIWKYYIAKE